MDAKFDFDLETLRKHSHRESLCCATLLLMRIYFQS